MWGEEVEQREGGRGKGTFFGVKFGSFVFVDSAAPNHDLDHDNSLEIVDENTKLDEEAEEDGDKDDDDGGDVNDEEKDDTDDIDSADDD